MPATTIARPRRRTAGSAVLAVLVLTATLLVGTAGPAGAGTILSVSPKTGLSATTTKNLNVRVSFAKGDAFYAIAECNTTFANGTACNASSAVGAPSPVPTGSGAHKFVVPVTKSFQNTDFTGAGGPGGTTTCAGTEGAQCAIFLSTYSSTGAHLNRDRLVDISFK